MFSFVIATATSITSAAEPKAGTFPSESLKVGKDNREYRLVVPTSVDLARPAPLVFAFHGFLIDSKDTMPLYSKLNEAVQKHRFILIYPNALDRSWAMSPDKMVKDLAFFDALLAKLSSSKTLPFHWTARKVPLTT